MSQDYSSGYKDLLSSLLCALKVEDAAQNKVFSVLSETGAIEEKENRKKITRNESSILAEVKEEIQTFLELQTEGLAILRIQSAWRRHQDRKRFNKYKSLYIPGRNKRLQEMVRTEVIYTTVISLLAQTFAVPLLNTQDRILKEQSSDISEILQAVVDIDKLHRSLLRKFRGFLDEKCDWPIVDGFGNIFLDLQEEFRVYGEYIRQFKFTLDLLDRMEIGEISRPRLAEFLESRSSDNVGFKGLISKPLNRIASYEIGLREMSNSTAAENGDFKTIMQALSIISETNKYVNTCLNQSYNTAKIKHMEERVGVKPSKGQPELAELYHKYLPDANIVEQLPIEVFLKRGVKKKLAGLAVLFTNMVLICVAHHRGIFKTKRIYLLPAIRINDIQGTTFQIVALKDTEGVEEELIPVQPNSSIRIRCETIREVREIVDTINQLKEAIQTNRVFGIDLNIIVDREDRALRVPHVLVTLCEYTIEHFAETVGLFRVPGSAKVEKILRNAFNQEGGDMDLAEHEPTAEDVSGLIKLYFRELPCALCGDLFIKFVEAQKKFVDDKDSLCREFKSLVCRLPPNNRITLLYICHFMFQIASHKEINKMNCSNVAMCIGPDLMRPPVDSIELALMIPQANEALAKLVEWHKVIFDGVV